MARAFRLSVRRDGEEMPVTGISMSLRPGGQSEARVTLDPSPSDPLVLDEQQEWSVWLMHENALGVEAGTPVMASARAAGATYENAFRPPVGSSLGEFTAARTIILQDRFAAYRDYAPGADSTQRETDTRAQATFIAQRMGMGSAIFAGPSVPIERIDYTRESGWWEPLAGFLGPLQILDIVDPSSGKLFLYDTTKRRAGMMHANRKLTAADYNPASVRVDRRALVTQVKVVWVDFDGEGPSEPLATTRTDSDVHDDGNGNLTRTWIEWAELRENPDDPSEVTREVITAQGTASTAGDDALVHERTEMRYEDDYTRVVETTTVTSAKVDLPYTGSIYGEVERVTETYAYDDDPLVPGRKFLRKRTRVREGAVVYVFSTSEADPDGSIVKRETATPAIEASHARQVDLSADATQAWEWATISTWTEHYKRLPGQRAVLVSGLEIDNLRERPTGPPWHRIELGDTAVDPQGKARFEYVGTAGRKAVTLDATKIGKAAGLAAARRMIARTDPPTSIRLTLTRPDYVDFRLGWVIELDDDAPQLLEGLYLCTAVDFEARAPEPQRPNVVQTIELLRLP